MTARHLQLRVDIDADLATRVTLAAMQHGTSVAEEVSAALAEWLLPVPVKPEQLATVLHFESRGA